MNARKTIVIYNHTRNSFSGNELELRGCGGSETDIINLARVFASREFNVHVFCPCPSPGVFDGVVYHDILQDLSALRALEPDLLIMSRSTSIPGYGDPKRDFGARKVVLWAHDIPRAPAFRRYKKFHGQFDRIVTLSKYHKWIILEKYAFIDPEEIVIIRNGIDMSRFRDREKTTKVPGRLIYSSTPFRGLKTSFRISETGYLTHT